MLTVCSADDRSTAGVFGLPVRSLLSIPGAPRGCVRSPSEVGPARRAVRRDGGEAKGGGHHAPFVTALRAAAQGIYITYKIGCLLCWMFLVCSQSVCLRRRLADLGKLGRGGDAAGSLLPLAFDWLLRIFPSTGMLLRGNGLVLNPTRRTFEVFATTPTFNLPRCHPPPKKNSALWMQASPLWPTRRPRQAPVRPRE